MGITTLSVQEETAERFQRHRHDDHHNTDEALRAMLDVHPAYDDLACVICGEPPRLDAPLNENHGIIEFFTVGEEHGGGSESMFFCSRECHDELRDQQELWNPDEPDAFIVGGIDEARVRLEDSIWFERDGADVHVGVDLPGVFSGTAAADYEYDYVGEPFYVEYRDRVIESGVIEAIHHEEWMTFFELGAGVDGSPTFYHPDREKRESKRERFTIWYDAECPDCGETNRTHEGGDEQLTCRECETTFDRPPVPDDLRDRFYDADGEPREIVAV